MVGERTTEHSVERRERSYGAECVRVLQSADTRAVGSHAPLTEKLTIGRQAAPDIELVFEDRKLSRRHATIRRDGKAILVEDHASTNGTYVDGKRVLEQRIAPGAIVRVGDTLLELDTLESAAERPMPSADPELLGNSPAFIRLLVEIDRVAPRHAPVLLMGETGTGKELVAARLHRQSGRGGPLVALNCAAIAENLVEATLFGHKRGAFTGAVQDGIGYFARAENGTLFLDEIGELALHLQPKLLRVLESGVFTPVGTTSEQKASVRVVAATNRNLMAETRADTFREDLLARLSGHILRLPPLRERRSDILLLANHFVGVFSPDRTITFDTQAAEALLLHPWRMNVRELRFTMERLACIDDAVIGEKDVRNALLSATRDPGAPHTKPHHRLSPGPSAEELAAVIERYRGNISKVAAHYQRERRQIYRWIEQRDIDLETFRPRHGGRE